MNQLKKYSLCLLALVVAALGSFGCASDSGAPTQSVSEALTPISVYENVAPGSVMSCTASLVTLYEDPANPTPAFTAISLIRGTGTSYYNTNALAVTAFLTAAQWSSACAVVNTPGRNTRVTVTYDNDIVGYKKTLTQPPTFSLL